MTTKSSASKKAGKPASKMAESQQDEVADTGKKRERKGAVFAEIGEKEKALLDARVATLNSRGEGRWTIGMILSKLVREASLRNWGEPTTAVGESK